MIKRINILKISSILIIIGCLLILYSLFILLSNKYEDYKVKQDNENIIKELNVIEEDDSNDLVVANISGEQYIGSIYIPSLDLTLPIMKEYSYSKLKKSPCVYYGSINNNDLIICAHSYKNHFRYIKNLNQGDIIVIKDVNGTEYFYKVEDVEILEPTDVIDMIENDFDLTLFTCTSDGNNRVTVRANRLYN